MPALDEFVTAAHGKPNLDFWRSLCHVWEGSSIPKMAPLTGWVQVFFPYLIQPGCDDGFGGSFEVAEEGKAKKKLTRNVNIAAYIHSMRARANLSNFIGEPEQTKLGVKLELFPPAMSTAPFKYVDVATRQVYKMAFFAGVTSLVQRADGSIEPMIGWAVMDSGDTEPKQGCGVDEEAQGA